VASLTKKKIVSHKIIYTDSFMSSGWVVNVAIPATVQFNFLVMLQLIDQEVPQGFVVFLGVPTKLRICAD